MPRFDWHYNDCDQRACVYTTAPDPALPGEVMEELRVLDIYVSEAISPETAETLAQQIAVLLEEMTP